MYAIKPATAKDVNSLPRVITRKPGFVFYINKYVPFINLRGEVKWKSGNKKPPDRCNAFLNGNMIGHRTCTHEPIRGLRYFCIAYVSDKVTFVSYTVLCQQLHKMASS